MKSGTFLFSAAIVAFAAIALTKLTDVPVRHEQHDRMCSDVPCFTMTARTNAIRSHNAQTKAAHRYLVIGDSITEFAVLEPICGAAPINAGISGATTATWLEHARPLADTIKPDFIVVALGTNDGYLGRISGYSERLDALINSLKPYTVIIVPPPPSPDMKYAARFAQFTSVAADKPNAAAPLPTAITVDGVHLTAEDYVPWKAALREKSSATICPAGQR